MKFKIIVKDITTKNLLIKESKYLHDHLDSFWRTLPVDKIGHLMTLCLMPNIIQVEGFKKQIAEDHWIKIIVDSKKTKKKILKQSSFLHWKCEDLDIDLCSNLAHLYLHSGKEEYSNIFEIDKNISFVKKIAINWTPNMLQDINALTSKNSPFYSEELTKDIINQYGSIAQGKKQLKAKWTKECVQDLPALDFKKTSRKLKKEFSKTK